ncbi:MAG: hypothetical protein DRP87_08475 [Spirochaetes bacterium]|mgnify:CR=1 FL=1|nr:MAG: hypothetical protein DRP87_08475 [Spirochaetota bacterium]
MGKLELNIVNEGKLYFETRALINAGRTGRDSTAVKKHIEELRKEGINISGDIPIFHPKVRDRVTIDSEFEVLPNSKSCGEVEPVLLFANNKMYVGLGSDHTDREFEKVDIRVSKQIYPNVLAPDFWKYDEVAGYWDDLVLRSWVHKDGEKVLYQEDTLGTLLPPEELINRVKKNFLPDLNGLILFTGTVPIIGGQLIFSKYFGMELYDEKKNRSIRHEYTIKPITWIE